MHPHQRIQELSQLLRQYENAYYVLNQPIISDYEYDKLFLELKTLENQYPEYIHTDSPTQRIATAITKSFPTVYHMAPMISLENSYNVNDLIEFDNRIHELLENQQVYYCVEPKYDGSSIALLYTDDKLIRAATRGDGTQGDDITVNARTIKSIPLTAPFSKYGITSIEIRGEVIIDKASFSKINQNLLEEGGRLYANPRNYASGALRLQDANEVSKRCLTAILYHVAYCIDRQGNDVLHRIKDTHADYIELLKACGFRTPRKEFAIYNSIQEVISHCDKWDKLREEFEIEIDGIVIKVNDLLQQNICGNTAHHPRWAIAYKFKAKQAQTKLLHIDFQVGRTGTITPVAKLQAVPLAGVVISSVSLFNEENIIEKDIRIGDTIIVERAGDVIPYISGSIKEMRSGTEEVVVFPHKCPVCDMTLVKIEAEATWRCDNTECPAQIAERIIHYCSKDAMDIVGMGSAIIHRLCEMHLLNSIADLYKLDFEEIKKIEGFGEKSAEKINKAIQTAKKRPLHKLIFGLGIRYVGETTAKNIAKEIQQIEDLYIKTIDELMQWQDIGPKVAHSIFAYFNTLQNQELISFLKAQGVNTYNNNQNLLLSETFMGKTFLFTGTLVGLTRTQAEELVEKHGGKIANSVSPKLNFLVAGDKAGSKLEKAQKIKSITIINEQEFQKMINTD